MGSSCLGDSLIPSLLFFTPFLAQVEPRSPRVPAVPPLAGDTQNAARVGQLKPAAAAANLRLQSPLVEREKKGKLRRTAFSECVLP